MGTFFKDTLCNKGIRQASVTVGVAAGRLVLTISRTKL